MNGSPSSRQRATPVASTRLSPRGRPRSSHSPIRLNGQTPSSLEPSRRAGRWSYRISSRCLKRGRLLLSIIAGAEINHTCTVPVCGKGGLEIIHQFYIFGRASLGRLVAELRRIDADLCFQPIHHILLGLVW